MNRQGLLVLLLPLIYQGIGAEQPDAVEASIVQFEHSPINSSRLPNTLSKGDFNQKLSAAHQDIRSMNWQAAESSLQKALSSKPESTVAQELLLFVQKQNAADSHIAAQKQIQADLASERWADAVNASASLNSDFSVLEDQIERARKLSLLEKQIDRYLNEPSRFTQKSLQTEINRINSQALTINLGERVGGKHDLFVEKHELWLTPIEILIRSDGLTHISITPGRELGRFRSQRLRVKPGEYELSGRRQDHREVRRPLSINPGDSIHEVTVIAHEKF